jgi:hypothetical protein
MEAEEAEVVCVCRAQCNPLSVCPPAWQKAEKSHKKPQKAIKSQKSRSSV